MNYVPQPLDTAGVKLPAELDQLIEQLAVNVHEAWSRLRVEQGWTLGRESNDARKTHPSLVAYCDLPEEERELDRRTAAETLKTILALGYRIERA